MCVCACTVRVDCPSQKRAAVGTPVCPRPHATCPATYHSYRHSTLSCPRVGVEHRDPCAVRCECDAMQCAMQCAMQVRCNERCKCDAMCDVMRCNASAARCEWAQCSKRVGNTRSAVRLAGRGCVSDTRPPGVTCNAWDASDRWHPAALEKVWGHAAVGWARECPRIHGRNMQIAHGWGTPRPAVASRHSGGVIRLAAGQETRGWLPPTHTAQQAIVPARIAGAQAVEGVVLFREGPLDRRVPSPSQR